MSDPLDASDLRSWMQQVEYWLSDYRSSADHKAEALQMTSSSLSMLIRSAETLRQQVRERLGVQ